MIATKYNRVFGHQKQSSESTRKTAFFTVFSVKKAVFICFIFPRTVRQESQKHFFVFHSE